MDDKYLYEKLDEEYPDLKYFEEEFSQNASRSRSKRKVFVLRFLLFISIFVAVFFLFITRFHYKVKKIDEKPYGGYSLSEKSEHYRNKSNTKYYAERELVRTQFLRAWDDYNSGCTGMSQNYGFPMGDELVPGRYCSCTETMGGYSLTLLDAADTLVVMGELDLFGRAIQKISSIDNFDIPQTVSFFETTIRALGGLISSHILAKEIFVDYDGKLLKLSVDLGDRLLRAISEKKRFYGLVSLANGTSPSGYPSDIASIGSNILEFGYLTKLTGDPKYYKAAKNAMLSIFKYRAKTDLISNTVYDDMIGAGSSFNVGAGMDSFLEYLLKGYIIFHDEDLMEMYEVFEKAIEKYVRFGGAMLEVNVTTGKVSSHVTQALGAFWGAMQVISGNLDGARRLLEGAAFLSKSYPFLPEKYDIKRAQVIEGAYIQRPELMESISYMSQAFDDAGLRHFAKYFVENVDTYFKSTCGYHSIRFDKDKQKIDPKQQSFLLAETFKYSYLVFDENNVFNRGLPGKTFVYTTEAHPLPVLVATDKQKFKKRINLVSNSKRSKNDISKTSKTPNRRQCSYSDWKGVQQILEMSSPSDGYKWREIGEIC